MKIYNNSNIFALTFLLKVRVQFSLHEYRVKNLYFKYGKYLCT